MKLNLKWTNGEMPEVEVNWCDIAEMNHVAKKVKEVLKNHKESKENDAKRIFISDDDLKDIYSILFRLTHRHEVYANGDSDEKVSHKYVPIIENEDFDINEFI